MREVALVFHSPNHFLVLLHYQSRAQVGGFGGATACSRYAGCWDCPSACSTCFPMKIARGPSNQHPSGLRTLYTLTKILVSPNPENRKSNEEAFTQQDPVINLGVRSLGPRLTITFKNPDAQAFEGFLKGSITGVLVLFSRVLWGVGFYGVTCIRAPPQNPKSPCEPAPI